MFDEFFVDFGKNAFFVFLSNLRLFYRLLRNARYNGHSANHGNVNSLVPVAELVVDLFMQ